MNELRRNGRVGVDKIERCPRAAGRVSSEDDDGDGRRRVDSTAIGVCWSRWLGWAAGAISHVPCLPVASLSNLACPPFSFFFSYRCPVLKQVYPPADVRTHLVDFRFFTHDDRQSRSSSAFS
jgi:hypothetical protein